MTERIEFNFARVGGEMSQAVGFFGILKNEK